MEQELRRVYYDPELGVEACLFQGIDQGFPEHFHTYYVIGTMDRGSREVTIAGETLRLAPVSWYSFSPASPTPAVRWGRSVWTGGGSTCRRRSWSGPLKPSPAASLPPISRLRCCPGAN